MNAAHHSWCQRLIILCSTHLLLDMGQPCTSTPGTPPARDKLAFSSVLMPHHQGVTVLDLTLCSRMTIVPAIVQMPRPSQQGSMPGMTATTKLCL